jgi:hypothetical protein
MNERIKELYNQSLEEKYQYGGSDAKPGEMYSNYITVLNPEKFAELIVRECADILMIPEHVMNHHQELTDYYRGWVNGRLLGIEHIKKHFGVEE